MSRRACTHTFLACLLFTCASMSLASPLGFPTEPSLVLGSGSLAAGIDSPPEAAEEEFPTLSRKGLAVLGIALMVLAMIRLRRRLLLL